MENTSGGISPCLTPLPENEKLTGNRNILKRDEVCTGHRVYVYSPISHQYQTNKGRSLLGYGMQFMNQLGGINLLVYASYAPRQASD